MVIGAIGAMSAIVDAIGAISAVAIGISGPIAAYIGSKGIISSPMSASCQFHYSRLCSANLGAMATIIRLDIGSYSLY